MFCSHCGSQINDNAKFCTNCGAPVTVSNQQPVNTISYNDLTPPVAAPSYAGNGEIRNGIPTPGFSDRVNHPEILEAVRKNRKASKIFAFITIPLPIIGFLIYSYVSGDIKTGQALIYGLLVSFVFLLFSLASLSKQRAKNSYEATVIDKKIRERTDHNNNSDVHDIITEYITVVRTTDGKKKKIIENSRSQIWAYYYLETGDRFKYHAQFNFPYELYDKSHAPYIACVGCGTQNPIESDRCSRCNLPLLK